MGNNMKNVNNNNNMGNGSINNMNNNNNMNKNINNNMNGKKGPICQPQPEPYYNNKPSDPFAKYLNNSHVKRDFGPNKNNLYHSGNKESKNWMGTDNKFSQPIRSICARCGKPIQDSWTEDAKQRMYHNECFVCCECGVSLGQMGKYVTITKGVVCKP